MAETAVPAASAPADAPLAPIPDLSALSADERKTWRETGTLPSPTSPSRTSAVSSPAVPPDAAASTEAQNPPASEPGTAPADDDLSSYKPKTAKRIQELLEENRSLRQERERYAATTPQPVPMPPPASTTAAPATVQQFISSLDLTQPLLSDAQFYERFPDATMTDLVRYTTRYELLADHAQQTVAAARAERIDGWRERTQQAVEHDPEFLSKVPPRLLALVPVEQIPPGVQPTAASFFAQEVLESPHGPALLRYVADHPEEEAALAAATSPVLMARAVARLEAKLERPSVHPQPVTPPSSSAPPPVETVGSRRTTPVNEADDALIKGDFRRYRELMNAKELAARQGGAAH